MKTLNAAHGEESTESHVSPTGIKGGELGIMEASPKVE